MNIKICDVCHSENNEDFDKVVRSTYRVGRKDAFKSLRIDVCDKHKDYVKQFKGMKEFEEAVYKL